jgi:hypothetical protein
MLSLSKSKFYELYPDWSKDIYKENNLNTNNELKNLFHESEIINHFLRNDTTNCKYSCLPDNFSIDVYKYYNFDLLNLSDNQLYDLSVACFPLQDYYIECFKVAYYSNSTRQDSVKAFSATHTALLRCFKNLIYNERSTVEPLYPETNKPVDDFTKFIIDSAKKAAIQIPKVAIQSLDPNVAIAKAVLDAAVSTTSNGKFFDDNKVADYSFKKGIQVGASAGAASIGILPTQLTAVYYGLLLLEEGLLTEEENSTSVPITCPEDSK